MTQPALAVLESFTEGQRRQAMYPFEANERREWHFVPRRRPGVTLGAMQPTQQERVWALLRASLSQQGVQKTRTVISTETILGELSGNPGYRDATNYALVFFGDPASGQPWSWRFEGHHLSLTFTIVPGQGVAVAPAFLGANPATVPAPHAQAGFKALGTEEADGFRRSIVSLRRKSPRPLSRRNPSAISSAARGVRRVSRSRPVWPLPL